MKKMMIIIIFICLYAAIAFFGIGPVLFADGTMQERLITLLAVLLIIVLVTYMMRRILKFIS